MAGCEENNCGEGQKTDIIERWSGFDQNIGLIFKRMAELGLDIGSLRERLEAESRSLSENESTEIGVQLDIQQVLFHIREYLSAVMQAIELKDKKGVSILSVHKQKSLNNSAMDYASRTSGKARESLDGLYDLFQFICNEEANAEVIMNHINRCR